MKSLAEFLDVVGAKPTTKQSEWLMECWECGGPKLYFNIDKGIGFCVKCNQVRTLYDIARFVAGVPVSQIRQFIEDHQMNEARHVGFKDTVLTGLLGGSEAQTENPLVEMRWPEGYRSLYDGRKSVQGRKAADYLVGRGFNLEVLYELEFGYCVDGYYGGRIIVPTFMDAQLVYWQARDYTGQVPIQRKILNPRSEHGHNGKSQVLFNYDRARQHRVCVVTESWGSCLAVGTACVGVNGKHISDTQLRLLSGMDSQSFIILFDAGEGTIAAWNNAERLSALRKTYVATLPWGDPNEVPRSIRNEAIMNCVPYSKTAYIKFKLQNLA